MILGVTFDGQNVTARQDGRIRAAVMNDGVLSGMEQTIFGSAVTIARGSFVAAGRLMELDENTTIAMNNVTGVARVKVRIDLTKVATQDEFQQAEIVVDYAARESEFPTLEKENINEGGLVYEYAVCTMDLIAGVISTIRSDMEPVYLNNVVRRVTLSGTASITAADNTLYRVENASIVSIHCPTGDYSCHIIVETALSGAPSISVSGDLMLRGDDLTECTAGDIWEFSIMDGLVLARRWFAE